MHRLESYITLEIVLLYRVNILVVYTIEQINR